MTAQRVLDGLRGLAWGALQGALLILFALITVYAVVLGFTLIGDLL